jgi:hypothetical protein
MDSSIHERTSSYIVFTGQALDLLDGIAAQNQLVALHEHFFWDSDVLGWSFL